MYHEILTAFLKLDSPKTQTDIKSPWTYIGSGRRELVINFCKKYPWAINQEFLITNKLDIISPKKCPNIESHMEKYSWIPLYAELSKPLPQNEYYPINYWERLACICCLEFTGNHVFIDVMLKHGFKFTEGVCERLLLHSQIENPTKKIIAMKIKHDREKLLLDLTDI